MESKPTPPLFAQAHFGHDDTHKGFSDVATAHKLQSALAASPGAANASVVIHPHVGHAFMNATPEGGLLRGCRFQLLVVGCFPRGERAAVGNVLTPLPLFVRALFFLV